MEIGAQLYTLRDFCKTTEAFAETLRRVADIGYKTVQVSGTCAYDPAWLKERLAENGLRCVLTHIPREELLADAAAVAARHDVFDCRYVGLGCFPLDEEKDGCRYADFLEQYRPVAKTLREHGKYFMYHNHDAEFRRVGNTVYLEKMVEDFLPTEMGFTLDTFWVQAGGGDPAAWLSRLSDRVPCIHLKDFAYGRKMAVLGEGNLNFDRIFEKARDAHVRYMLVEQDDCNGEDPFACLKRSYAYLRSRGF